MKKFQYQHLIMSFSKSRVQWDVCGAGRFEPDPLDQSYKLKLPNLCSSESYFLRTIDHKVQYKNASHIYECQLRITQLD